MNRLKLVFLLIMLSVSSIQSVFAEQTSRTSANAQASDTLSSKAPPNRALQSNSNFAPDTLNADNIERWLQSQQAFEKWGEKHIEILESSSEQNTEPENPMEMTIESLIAPLKLAGLYTSATQVASHYGFNNLEAWANITLRITKAAAAIEFESHPEMMDTSKLEALKNAPEINEQQKTMIIQAIEKNQLIVTQIISGTSPTDKQAVKPFLKRIHQLMETPI